MCQNLLLDVSLKHIFWEKILFKIRYFSFLKKAEREFNSMCFYTKLMKIFNSLLKIFKKQILPLLSTKIPHVSWIRYFWSSLETKYFLSGWKVSQFKYIVKSCSIIYISLTTQLNFIRAPFGLTLIFMLRMLCCCKNSVYFTILDII